MKNILVVHNDINLLKTIKSICDVFNDNLKIFTSSSENETIKFLQKKIIHLAIFDPVISEIDTLKIIAHLSNTNLDIPVLIMLPFSNSNIEKIFKNKNNEFYLIKPFDSLKLKIKILEVVSATSEDFKDNFNGFSLSSFLLLCEMNRRSYSIDVKKRNMKGSIDFKDGIITSAVTSNFNGQRAVFEMLEWENTIFDIEYNYKNKEKNTSLSAIDLLLDNIKQKETT